MRGSIACMASSWSLAEGDRGRAGVVLRLEAAWPSAATFAELLERGAEARDELDAIADGHDPARAAAEVLAATQAEVDRLHAELRAARREAAQLRRSGRRRARRRSGSARESSASSSARARPGRRRGRRGRVPDPAECRAALRAGRETASGGELSRIALAIAAVAGGETMVFDEIDAGHRRHDRTCGRARRCGASRRARRCSRSPTCRRSRRSPTGTSRVEKIPGDPTHTRIERLDDAQRRDELERMLGGADFLATIERGV